jgi:hypothetical protein
MWSICKIHLNGDGRNREECGKECRIERELGVTSQSYVGILLSLRPMVDMVSTWIEWVYPHNKQPFTYTIKRQFLF